ncbi:phage tail tape measure protein [Lachnospiraceae bacterium HCP1S3_A10]
MAKEVEAKVKFSGKTEPSFKKTMKVAKASLNGLKKMGKVVAGATAAAGAAVAAGTVAMTKELAEVGKAFESAKNTIRIGTGATGDALNDLYADMKAVYKEVPTSLEDASGAIADYNTRLGLTGEPLQELSKQAIQVNKLLGEDISTTIEDSSKAFQQWGISASDMSKEMDYIFKVSQSTGTGFNELMSNMQTYGVQLQEMGYDFDTSAALMGQLDKAGVNTGQVLGGLSKSVATMAADGLSASEGLQKYVEQIKNAGSATEATAIASEVFGKKSAAVMVDAIRDGTFSASELTASLQASSETIDTAAQDTYTFSDKLKMLKQNAETSLEPIASGLIDIAQKALPYIDQGLNAIIVSVIQRALPSIMGLIKSLVPLILQVTAALMPLVEAVMGFIAQVLPVVIDTVTALTPIITQLISVIVAALTPAIDTITTAIQPVINNISDLVMAIIPYLQAAIELLTPAIQYLAGVVSTALAQAFEIISPIIENVTNVIKGIMSFIKDIFVGDWSAAWEDVKTIFGNAFDALVGLAKAPLNLIIGAINAVIGGLNSISVDIPDWVPGFGGETFGIDIPLIPKLAKGGFTKGISIAGEAGTEAVISFDPTYRQQNLENWAKAGRMLGASDGELLSLLDNAGSHSDGVVQYNMGGIEFKPQITINGNADKQDIVDAIREAEPEFMDMLEELLSRRRREAYG